MYSLVNFAYLIRITNMITKVQSTRLNKIVNRITKVQSTRLRKE